MVQPALVKIRKLDGCQGESDNDSKQFDWTIFVTDGIFNLGSIEYYRCTELVTIS